MKKSWILAGILALGFCGIASAQETKQEDREELDEIVIDSRFKIKKENSGKIVHKITCHVHLTILKIVGPVSAFFVVLECSFNRKGVVREVFQENSMLVSF